MKANLANQTLHQSVLIIRVDRHILLGDPVSLHHFSSPALGDRVRVQDTLLDRLSTSGRT